MQVLLGIGGSDDGFRALERTVERVVTADDDDLTVAVVDNPEVDRPADAVVERIEAALAAAGVAADVRRLEGDPGPALVSLAETEGFDELVLGGGEQSPMGKITVGDIAEFVVLNATVTVTLVR